MNIDDDKCPKVLRCSSKWKCGLIPLSDSDLDSRGALESVRKLLNIAPAMMVRVDDLGRERLRHLFPEAQTVSSSPRGYTTYAIHRAVPTTPIQRTSEKQAASFAPAGMGKASSHFGAMRRTIQ